MQQPYLKVIQSIPTARQQKQKHLDHQSAPTDIYKAKSPFQVYQNSAAPGAPEHTLTSICEPGVFARDAPDTV